MFLDEKLKAIYESKIYNGKEVLYDTLVEGCNEIVATCVKELPDPNLVREYIVALKRVNYSYKLFNKQHDVANVLKENAFELYCWSRISDDKKAKAFFKQLGWKVPTNGTK